MTTDRGFDRLVYFSDAVVAIAISLLILPVVDAVSNNKEPVQDLVRENGGRLLAFAISFAVIAKFWVVHHQMFERVKGYTVAVVWTNMLWLATIVFVPLPTELLGNDLESDALVRGVYVGSVLAVSASLTLVNVVLARTPELHRDPDHPPEWYGGIAVTGMILVALFVAVFIPVVGMYAMFLVALAAPVEQLFIRRAGPPPP